MSPCAAARTEPALCRPDEADAFLVRVLKGPISEAPHVMADCDGQEGPVYWALTHLVAECQAALALWAIPEMPEWASLGPLRCPAGAHPARVAACLASMGDGGEGPDVSSDARAWREEYFVQANRFHNGTAQSARIYSLTIVLACLILQPDCAEDVPESKLTNHFTYRTSVIGAGLHEALRAAARIRAYGPGAAMIPSAPLEVEAEARAVLLDVFVRHAEGRPVPQSPILPADLAMLAQGTSAARRLAVVMAPFVQPDLQPSASRLDVDGAVPKVEPRVGASLLWDVERGRGGIEWRDAAGP